MPEADDELFETGSLHAAPSSEAAGGGALSSAAHAAAPLAVRMRPRTLEELVGQAQLRAPGSPLRQLVEGDQSMSLLLWGPPGTGKTTIASILSQQTDRRFVEVSAVSAGVKEVRAAIDAARAELVATGHETVLFVDEVHRFSKAQQDALLPGVENRWVTLVAATTENPFFSVISPLLSRSLLLRLESLTDDDIRAVLDHALADERGLGGAYTVEADALDHLVRLAGGDARRSLTYLEAAAGAASARGSATVDLETAETAVDQAAVRYDRQGDQHYDVTSAFIKSLRGSDVDAALHYLARMLEAGEDPRFIARRLVILASEDIGLADPTALPTAVAAAQAVQLIGMPEARLNLAQATIALAVAPKSNAVTTAIGAASADVRAGKIGPVPPHLRDAHYQGAKKLGHGCDVRLQPRRAVRHRGAAVRARRRPGRGVLQADLARRRGRDQGALGAGSPDHPRTIGSLAMAWVLVTVTAVLAVLVLVLALLTVRLLRRIDRLEERVAADPLPSSDPKRSADGVRDSHAGSLDGEPAAPQFVITRIGEPEAEDEPVPTVPAPVFADLLLKETVVQTASLFHGLRRALSPETRNRIRFHMRQEVKRSRKQRRTELREVRREWAARQRAGMGAEETAA